MLSKKMTLHTPDYLWFCLLGFLIAEIVLVWYLSFSVPVTDIPPIKWMRLNKLVGFSFYVAIAIIIFVLSMGIVFSSWDIIQHAHPLTFGGVFLYSSTILLLSSFFQSAPVGSTETRFYDNHPLIFYTVVGLLVMGLIASCSTTVKMHRGEVHLPRLKI
jgi:hypothetical protein